MQLSLRPEPMPCLTMCAEAQPWHWCGAGGADAPPTGAGSLAEITRQQVESFAIDRGQAAAWLVGGNAEELLAWMPDPQIEGSRTTGNYFPRGGGSHSPGEVRFFYSTPKSKRRLKRLGLLLLFMYEIQ